MTKQNEGPDNSTPGQEEMLDYSTIILPRAELSEQQILGSIIQEGKLIKTVDLSPSDFCSEQHQAIFSVMKDMERRGVPIDISTLFEEIRKSGKDEITGGSSQLTYCERLTPTTANLPYHVKIVKEAAAKRQLLKGIYSVWKLTANGGSLENIRVGIVELTQLSESPNERPEIKREAFYGLAGEIVNLISPHSEADPVALLANFLTAYGNVIGDKAHFRVEADRHPMRLFFVLVGDTSKGRKGTSWGYIKRPFEALDHEWAKNIQTGLSSGEGLIWAVRDEIGKHQAIREKGKVVGYEEVVVDKGVDDKRLLIVEPEFSTTLRVMERDGNTLSPTIRCAWDTGDLQVLTKNSPAKATGAHISIIGHITRQELIRYLTTTEAGNGFGNRFLWLYVRRSKSLPFGGGFHKENIEPIMKKLKAAIEFARDTGEITWAEETRPLWEAVYPKLSEVKPGLIGALTARAEAYVTRLACIYALLDISTEIRPEHLKAALALWEYVEDSVKFIFRDTAGVPLVNELRELKGKQNLSKTEIHNHLGRNSKSEEIDEALAYMEGHGEASKEKVQTGTKPKEVWNF